MARKTTSNSRRNTVKTKKAKPLASAKTRVAALEKSLKASRQRVAKLETTLAVLEKIVTGLVTWARGADGQLFEQDDALRNLFALVGTNDVGSYERPSLPSCLGILVDRGGAQPIDSNAADILRGSQR